MATITTIWGRRTAAFIAVGALALSPISAEASEQNGKKGINAGEVIAGALIIGGLAALISSAGRDRSHDQNNYYSGDPASSREAIRQCTNAAEKGASRYSYGRRANVTDIRKVEQKKDGFRVKGRITVGQNQGRGASRWDTRYENGEFTCDVRFGRVTDLKYKGIRGLS